VASLCHCNDITASEPMDTLSAPAAAAPQHMGHTSEQTSTHQCALHSPAPALHQSRWTRCPHQTCSSTQHVEHTSEEQLQHTFMRAADSSAVSTASEPMHTLSAPDLQQHITAHHAASCQNPRLVQHQSQWTPCPHQTCSSISARDKQVKN
jgi:hypothetical protein